MPGDYLQVNLANWNSRVPFHEVGYGLDAYRDDRRHLSAGSTTGSARSSVLCSPRGCG